MKFLNELFPLEMRKTLHIIWLTAFLVGLFIGVATAISLN